MVAVVHALAMYTKDAGRTTPPQPAYAGTSAAFSWRGLTASTAYLIDWGEGSPDTSANSNGSGVLSSSHTYGSAGRYTVTLRNAANTSDIKVVDLAVGGGLTIPGTIYEDASNSYGFALLPETSYTVYWGDGESDDFSTSAAVNEVQTLTRTGSPTGGSFTVAIAGAAAITVPYNASVSAFQALVDAKPTLVGNVTVGGSVGAWTLTYSGDLGGTNVPTPTINYSGLTGGTSPQVAATTNTTGVVPGAATLSHTYVDPDTYSLVVKYAAYDETVAEADVEVLVD